MAARFPITATPTCVGASPALPTALMLTNLRARLERQKPRGSVEPMTTLFLSVAFVLLGALLALAGV